MASCADGAGLASPLRSAAGIRRCFSRSLMYSSYFAVPGRGGASAGMPPAHAGMASLTPAARLALTVPQLLKLQPARTAATIAAIWRALIGIGGQVTTLIFMDCGPQLRAPARTGVCVDRVILFVRSYKCSGAWPVEALVVSYYLDLACRHYRQIGLSGAEGTPFVPIDNAPAEDAMSPRYTAEKSGLW
jgi:hypothetical protein